MIRLLIVGGTRLYREGLADLLGGRNGIAVVGANSDWRDAAANIEKLRPDVLVVDMATTESGATLCGLKQAAPGMPIVALGVAELEADVLACAEAGVAGYVTREGSLEELRVVVENAARGELQCSPRIAGSLLRRVAALAAHHQPTPAQTRLTIREHEIVRLIEQDLSNKQIATRLGIEVATVKNHVHNLLEKLNVHRRKEAARLLRHSSHSTPASSARPPEA